MAITTFKGNSEFLLVAMSNRNTNRKVPMSVTLEVRKGSDLFDYIMGISHFEDIKNKELNTVYEGAEDNEYNRKSLRQFKEDVNGAEVKITINIELEKYEN